MGKHSPEDLAAQINASMARIQGLAEDALAESDTQAEDSFIECILDNEDGHLSDADVCGHLFLAFCRATKARYGICAEHAAALDLARNLAPEHINTLDFMPHILRMERAIKSAVDNGAPESAYWSVERLITAISDVLPDGEYAAWVDSHPGVIARFALARRYR